MIKIIAWIEAFFLIIAAVLSDICSMKIKNYIVYPFMAIGLLTAWLTGGTGALLNSFAACLIPAVLLFVLFALKMLGAGDIKLFCALGAILGITPVLLIMVMSFLCGGVLAFFIMLLRKNAIQRFGKFFSYLKTCLFTRTVLPYGDFSDKKSGGFFRFSYAVLLGTLLFFAASITNMKT